MALQSRKTKTWAKSNPFQKFKSVEAARSGVEEGAGGYIAIAATHLFSAGYAWRFPHATLLSSDPAATPILLLVMAVIAVGLLMYLRNVPNRFVAIALVVWAAVGLPFPLTAWLYGWAAFPAFNILALLAGILATRAAFTLHKMLKSPNISADQAT